MIGCLRTRVRKQPIIVLYFKFKNKLKFYNLEARSPAQQEQSNIFCSNLSIVMSSLQDVQPYTAWKQSMSLEGDMSSEQVERLQLGDFKVCQISPPSSLITTITLQGRAIKAVVDTAAMVTVICEEIYRKMKPKPPCLKATPLQNSRTIIYMNMAGRIVENQVRHFHISHSGAFCTDQQRHAAGIRLFVEDWSQYQPQRATSSSHMSYRESSTGNRVLFK